MRRLALGLLILFLLVVTAPLSAQRCNVFTPGFDNPFSDHHDIRQLRISWHLEKAGVSWIATRKGPRWIRYAPMVLVTALHVRGAIKGSYRIDWHDWVADAWMVSLPAQQWWTWALGYPLAGCYAWP